MVQHVVAAAQQGVVDDLLHMPMPPAEKVIRTVAVYLGILIVIRIAGKRLMGQMNSQDLVVVLLLSNVVQNAVIGQDDSLLGGIIGAVVLVSFNAAVVRASLTSEGVHRIMEGTSTVLARHGVWDTRALRHEGLRKADVDAALRRQNANDVGETESVSLEPGGAVVATLLPEQQSATRQDIERLEAKLDALLARRADDHG